MANALSGAAQNLPVQNNLQTNSASQNAQDQSRIAEQQDERAQSTTLRTQEQQSTNETTQARTETNQQDQQAQLAQTSSPTVSASGQERGSNVDITV